MSTRLLGRPPRSDAEWARDVERRIRTLEQPASLRVGQWVLNDVNDDLLLTRPGAEPIALGEPLTQDDLSTQLRGYITTTDLSTVLTGTPGGTPHIKSWVEQIPVIGDLVYWLTGVVDGGISDLTDWVASVPILGDLVESLTGIVAGGLTDLTEWAATLPNLVGGLLDLSWIPNLPATIITTGTLNVARLPALVTGLITDFTSSVGSLITTALGSLPSSLTSAGTIAVTALTGLGAGMLAWLQAAPAMALGAITGLGTNVATMLAANLNASAVTWLQSAPALAVTAITGLGAGMATWLQSAPAMAVGAITGLATGIGTWLASGGALPAATSAAISQITSLGGYLTHLTSGGVLSLAGLATGAIPAGITLAGQQVSGIGASLLDDVTDMIEAAEQTTAAAFGGIVAAASTAASSAIDQLDDAVEQVLDDAGTAVTAFGQSLQTAFTSWLGGWLGTTPGTASAPDVADAIANQRETIVGISTAVSQLQAAAAAQGATGVFGGDDFERTDNDDLGADWSLTYSGGDSSDGYLAITNGHQAAWEPGDEVTRSVFARRTATADYQTQTNYQKIVWTVGANFEAVNYSDKVWVRLYGRVNSDATKYVFAEIRRYPTSSVGPWIYAVQFGYKNTGSETLIGTETTIASVSPGDTFIAYFGVPTTDEDYHVLTRNGSEVKSWDDSSSPVAASGASYLGWGFGMQGAGSVIGGGGRQAAPASLDSITIADNAPAPGTYATLPAAGNAGRIYQCADVGLWLKDNGTDWDIVSLNDGPLDNYQEPPDTGWSWVNQGGASTATELGGQRITAPSGTRNWRLRTRSLSPSSNYTAVARLDATPSHLGASGFYSGIGLRASGSGNFLTFGPCWYYSGSFYTHLAVYLWTNPTTYSGTNPYFQQTYLLVEGRMPRWLRIRDDNTNRYFEYSHNGVDWSLALAQGRTTYFTPDQFIFGATNEGTGYDAVVRLRSLKGIT